MGSALLGNSQTFLGVLTTIIALCFFAKRSNFQNKSLQELWEDFFLPRLLWGICYQNYEFKRFKNEQKN